MTVLKKFKTNSNFLKGRLEVINITFIGHIRLIIEMYL